MEGRNREFEFCSTGVQDWRRAQLGKLGGRIVIGRKTGLRQDIRNAWGGGGTGAEGL